MSAACLPQGEQLTSGNPSPSGLCFSYFLKNAEKFEILINPDSGFMFLFVRFEAGELQRIRSIDEDDRTSLCPLDQVIINNNNYLGFL